MIYKMLQREKPLKGNTKPLKGNTKPLKRNEQNH